MLSVVIGENGATLSHFDSASSSQQLDAWLQHVVKGDGKVSSVAAPYLPVVHIPDDHVLLQLPGLGPTLLSLRYLYATAILAALWLFSGFIAKQSDQHHTRAHADQRRPSGVIPPLTLFCLCSPVVVSSSSVLEASCTSSSLSPSWCLRTRCSRTCTSNTHEQEAVSARARWPCGSFGFAQRQDSIFSSLLLPTPPALPPPRRACVLAFARPLLELQHTSANRTAKSSVSPFSPRL